MDSPQSNTLLDIRQHLDPHPSDMYIEHEVDVPAGASKFGIHFSYHNPFSDTNPKKATMFISIHDPQAFRGQRMNPGGRGDVELELWVTPDQSSEGAVPGEVTPGRWRILIDIRTQTAETEYTLKAYTESQETPPQPISPAYPENHVIRSEAGWYKGELHAHSTESDGKYPVHEVIEAARKYGMDYYSLTDHSTSSQWHKLAKLVNSETALIRSMEITSHIGHANLQGISDYVNVYTDRPGWTINQAAEEVHKQGGLFCVNHAFSGHLGWKDQSLDWNLVDLEEIYHNLEGANNSYQLSLWDQHLNAGYRIVGVGGTDSHNPYEGIHEIGQVVTWIYADELSEKGIIEGLRRGRVYISRGPEARFSAHDESGNTAEMWELLPGPGPAHFSVEFKWDSPLNLFVFKNGLIMDVIRSDPENTGWQKIEFSDKNPNVPGYYRIELHDVKLVKPYTGIIWRDYTTMRVLSNPIWIGRT